LVVLYWLHALTTNFLSSEVRVETILDYQLLLEGLQHFGQSIVLLVCLDDLTRQLLDCHILARQLILEPDNILLKKVLLALRVFNSALVFKLFILDVQDLLIEV
jgi:hypothetical protein